MPTQDNPLFDSNQYNLPAKKDKVVEPLPKKDDDAAPAVEFIRQKIQNIYSAEPNAKEEAQEAEEAGKHRSKHQQFMYELSTSGKSLAEIQTAWHNYYVNLPDHEKHEVWQEFYANHSQASRYIQATQAAPTNKPVVSTHEQENHTTSYKPRHKAAQTTKDIKDHLLNRVSSRTKLQKKQHLQSLAFGLGMGSIVLVILLFSFFNERFIAPFITPSKQVSSTQIIIDPGTTAVGPEPKIIIPKINVEIPVIYDEPSIDEHAVQRALEGGVLHYATTPDPGELGNGAIFGHSINNILNKGKYKFAFVLLKRLENGDTFYLQKDGKRYVYKVFDKKIVKPDDVSVLNSIEGRPATFSLITCDPPGTSINRLIVTGEQISPNPAANVASHVKQNNAEKPAVLPSNSPSLWSRLWGWLSS
jgi:sortase A